MHDVRLALEETEYLCLAIEALNAIRWKIRQANLYGNPATAVGIVCRHESRESAATRPNSLELGEASGNVRSLL